MPLSYTLISSERFQEGFAMQVILKILVKSTLLQFKRENYRTGMKACIIEPGDWRPKRQF